MKEDISKLSREELVEKNKKDAEALAKLYHEQMSGGLIDSIYESLVLDKSNRPTINERMFVSIYLPIFTAKVGQGKDNPYHLGVYTWVSDVAKSHFNPVDVIDDRGNVLFPVPPLADRNTIRTKMKDRRGLTQSVSTHLMMEGKVPHAVLNRTMAEDYYNATGLIAQEYYNEEHHKAWMDIFKRYNVLPEGELAEEKKEQKAEKINSDDMEFDDDF